MAGGAGIGDIASFATDVGAGQNGGVWVSLAEHKARGDGHDGCSASRASKARPSTTC